MSGCGSVAGCVFGSDVGASVVGVSEVPCCAWFDQVLAACAGDCACCDPFDPECSELLVPASVAALCCCAALCICLFAMRWAFAVPCLDDLGAA